MDCTVLIITKNAGKTLERTLKSVAGLACNVYIVDDYSTDTTQIVAREHGCRVITHSMSSFGGQRAFALSQVTSEWTLVLDSDEVLTSDNRKEILFSVQRKEYNGYYLSFRNHLFGKKLLHGELHKKMVLFRTKQATILEKEVHERYNVKGEIGGLPSEVAHYSYRSVLQIIQKFFTYSVLQAKQYRKEKVSINARKLFLNPLHMFFARYIKDQGYKDGWARIFLDYQFAHMEFLSYFLTPFVKEKRRISVDCGSHSVGGIVQSGIDRLVQGIYTHAFDDYTYYWFSFAVGSPHALPTRYFSQLWLPLKTIVQRCDIFLGVSGTIPWLLSFFPIQKILFLHDFGFFASPEKYSSSSDRLQKQTEYSIKIADKIVLFHREIYTEFVHRYPQYSYKAYVVPAGADHLERIKEQPVFIQPNKPLALFVGVVKPVKQIEKLISVVENTYCVIAGPQENTYVESLTIGKSQSIQYIKNFNDGQLKWLYKNADVMLYTSKHEGFCYPVLEALNQGLPVIAFDLPLFHEYKKYFKHLTLVQNESEMKRELQSIQNHKHFATCESPYRWATFNQSLRALWQPARLPRPNMQKIAFIFVLHNTLKHEIRRLTEEISAIGLSSSSVYWIDNSSNGAGYAAGVNEGIRKGLIDGCDVFIVLNPDISFKGITAENITTIFHEFDVWGFGMMQNKETYYGGEIDSWRLSGGLIVKKPKQRFVCVDYVTGSLMGFSRMVVQTIGLWSEEYFMYYEDVDFCQRAHKAGFQVGIDSQVIYKHFEASQINTNKEKWIANSRWRFFWKYSNMRQKVREILRLPKTLMGL